jgi:hypothetical protein
MVKPEFINERDLSYSKWHRLLPSRCYATNLDWIEYRYVNNVLKIVALIEEKSAGGTISESQKSVMQQISKAINVPAYVVYHDCCKCLNHNKQWKFLREDLNTGDGVLMNEVEYKSWLVNLT